jgi:hypothetical protein
MRKTLFYLGFLMERVLFIPLAILLKLQLFLLVSAILFCSVVFPLTLGALQCNKFRCLLF